LKHITATLNRESFAAFLPLLQQGCRLPLTASGSVKSFIIDTVHPDPEYVDKRIQTVFLNGKAVDDMEKTPIRNGDVLALSAAMPGLVGATFRRGGAYASFRRNVSVENGAAPENATIGEITVKLFNIIASEVGRMLLQKGVVADLSSVKDALESIGDDVTIMVDGQTTDFEDLSMRAEGSESVRLTIIFN
jgi:hypothetical protein